MRSFEQVIHEYALAKTGGSGNQSSRNSTARQAAADLQQLLNRKRWNCYSRHVELDLWGTESITISALASGTAVGLSSGTTSSNWIGQDVRFSGIQKQFTITKINSTTEFTIDPAYNSSDTAQSSGATATVYQRRVGLPPNFGHILSEVLHDRIPVHQASPAELNNLWAYGTSTSGSSSRMLSVSGGFMQVWPSVAGRLSYDYQFMPSNLFRYQEGRAHVKADNLRRVIGVADGGAGTKWLRLPAITTGMVLEEMAVIDRGGLEHGFGITAVLESDELLIDDDWDGPIASNFAYVISTDISTPPYLDAAILAYAQMYGGKYRRRELSEAILDAVAADDKLDDIAPVKPGRWASSITMGGRTDYVINI